MTNRPPSELQSARVRATLARFAVQSGPDAGREVDHLKLCSLSPAAAQALASAEAGGLAVPEAGLLTSHDGDATTVCWLFEVSRFDGTDQL